MCMLNVMYVKACQRGQKLKYLSTPSTYIPLDVLSFPKLFGIENPLDVLSFPKFFWIENQLSTKKVMSKNVMSPYSIFWRGQGPLCTEYTFDPFDMSKMSNITLCTVLHKSHKHHFWPFQHE